MRNFFLMFFILVTSVVLSGQLNDTWKVHDMSRPTPPVIFPGSQSTNDHVGLPPSDAIVLFNGTHLYPWEKMNGDPAEWKIENGYMEVGKSRGGIRTKQTFGDCQLHIEWSSPDSEGKIGQQNGNSGIFMMSKYEIQILNSYRNKTYADGQAAAIYGQYPPQVNCSRPPGQWQSYDIVFRRPHFKENGELLKPARVTLFYNGILVHDNVSLNGPTGWIQRLSYEAHPDQLPIMLQDHGNPVRFRNIWVRDLETYEKRDQEMQPIPDKEIELDQATLNRYTGKYELGPRSYVTIKKENETLSFYFGEQRFFNIFPRGEKEFFSKTAGVTVEFNVNSDGVIEGLTYSIGFSKRSAKKLPDNPGK